MKCTLTLYQASHITIHLKLMSPTKKLNLVTKKHFDTSTQMIMHLPQERESIHIRFLAKPIMVNFLQQTR